MPSVCEDSAACSADASGAFQKDRKVRAILVSVKSVKSTRAYQCMMNRNSVCASVAKYRLSVVHIIISGARCKVDKDCGTSMCCARHHGERVCKRQLVLGESCFVPDGGLAFSINQICPCNEGLLCRGNGQPQKRE